MASRCVTTRVGKNTRRAADLGDQWLIDDHDNGCTDQADLSAKIANVILERDSRVSRGPEAAATG